MKNNSVIKSFVLLFMPCIFLFAQPEDDYVYFKNFVTHITGELCEHIPPSTSFTAYLNGDQSKILIDNAPRWIIGTEPNIPGNGTFGVELGNFQNPVLAVDDSVFIRFTCNTSEQQRVLKSKVTAIPWYYFPEHLYLQEANLPQPPQNICLEKDTTTFNRNLSWSAAAGLTFNIYRRSYSDTLSDGRVRMLYHLVGSGISSNTFVDSTALSGERYGYIIYSRSTTGTVSSHSEEVNEDPYVRPGLDLTIKYVARLPRIDYTWSSSNPSVEGWPAVNDPVTWRAVVKNWSDSTLFAVSYHWHFDGVLIDSGQVNIAAGDTAFIDYSWNWTFDRHELKFSLDPANLIPEEEEENNQILVYTNAIAAGFYVEQSVYDYFHLYQKELGVGSNCWEDWAHLHVKIWNGFFMNAIYPDSPDGVIDRIRLDKITVVADGALPLAGGSYPTNMPNLNDRTIDLQWGFPATLLNGTFYSNHSSVTMNNPFYFEGSLLHELGHARYLIDLYGLNVHDDGTGNTVAITENGQLIVGTPHMPISGGAVYFTPTNGLMNGQYTFIDEYSTAAWNLIAGHRAVLGNYNAPGNIGVYLQDLPSENHLIIKDASGNILPAADVKIYQATSQSGVWYGKFYDDTPDLHLTADSNGVVALSRCPFSLTGNIVHTYGLSNSVIIMRVEKNGKIGYGFIEVTQFNMEYWRGNTALGNYDMQFTLIDPTSIATNQPDIKVDRFALLQNYPNPFNPETVIEYQLPMRSTVTLTIYNTLGEKIKTLINKETKSLGNYQVRWDGTNQQGKKVASGIYVYHLNTGTHNFSCKIILVR